LLKDEEVAKELFKRFQEIASIFPREVDLVELEEAAREAGREFAKRLPRPREFITRTFDKRNLPVRFSLDVIKTNVMGKLREFVLLSPSTKFSILVIADGVTKLSRTYDQLAEISPHSAFIDAYPSNGGYGVRLGEMSWISDFLLSIYVEEPITFSHIFCIWDEKVKT